MSEAETDTRPTTGSSLVDAIEIDWDNLPNLKDDLKSTVLIPAKDLNRLILHSEERVSPGEVVDFAKFLQNFTRDKEYQRARKEFLKACSVNSLPQLDLFSALCNVVVDRMKVFGKNSRPTYPMRFVRQSDSCGYKKGRDIVVLGLAEGQEAVELLFDEGPSAACPSSTFLKKLQQPNFRLDGQTLSRSQVDSHVPYMIGRVEDNIAPELRAAKPVTRSRKRVLENEIPERQAKKCKNVDLPLAPAEHPHENPTVAEPEHRDRVLRPLPQPSNITSQTSKAIDRSTDVAKLVQVMQLKNLSYTLDCLRSGSWIQSHIIGIVLDTAEVQLTYHDHSVIFLSLPFSVDRDELHFLATLYHLRALSRVQRGFVPPAIHPPSAEPDRELRFPSGVPQWISKSPGGELVLGKEDKPKTVVLGSLIESHLDFMVHKGTMVYHAELKGDDQSAELVVKFSFPSTNHTSESRLLWIARKVAKSKASKWGWVENLLPTLRYWEDILLLKDMGHPQEGIKAFLDANLIGVKFVYAERILRIICQDKLLPLTSLRKPVHYGKVFCDVLQCHRWLYDQPGILHRDISPDNIMVRRIGDDIYGVLTDLDVALERSKPEAVKNQVATRPFMARDCLVTPVHYYRQDLEAFFFVMLLQYCRHDLKGDIVSEEYDEWFSGTSREVYNAKVQLFVYSDEEEFEPPVTDDFEQFASTLVRLHDIIKSFDLRRKEYRDKNGKCEEGFDQETGDGTITYGKFLDCLKTFDGHEFQVHYLAESVPNHESRPGVPDDVEDVSTAMGRWLDDES